jgi:hypothetical protein
MPALNERGGGPADRRNLASLLTSLSLIKNQKWIVSPPLPPLFLNFEFFILPF